MKKQWFTALAVLSCLCMTACGGGETTTTPTKAPASSGGSSSTENTTEGSSGTTKEDVTVSEAPEATKAPEEVNPVYEFTMKLDGATYEFPMKVSRFESKGWKCKEDLSDELTPDDGTTVWWEKDGVIYIVDMYNASANTLPLSECVVSGIRTEKDNYAKDSIPNIVLPGDIKLGEVTREDIVAAYGEPGDVFESSEDHYTMYYDLERKQYVHLTLISGVLMEVEIRNRVALEGAATEVEVSYAIPDMVENYTAPTVAGDVYNMVVTIDSDSYEVPFPVAELLEDEFILLPEYWNLVIPSDDSADVMFRYGNITVDCKVRNFAKYATTVQNCFVTEIAAEKYGYLQPLKFSVLGGIKLGMTESELEASLSGFTYEKEKSTHTDYVGNTYTISNPDHATQNYFIMTDEDGVVNFIRVSRYDAPTYGTGEATAKNFDIKNEPVIPEDSIYAFWMNKDGDEFRLPMDFAEMEKMGWVFEQDATAVLNPGEEITTQTWKKENITMYTMIYNPGETPAPVSECQIVEIMVSEAYSIELFTEYNGKFILPGGIQLFASTEDDIIKAYGEPSYYYESEIYYHLRYFTGSGRDADLYVDKGTGKLNKVEMSNKITWE